MIYDIINHLLIDISLLCGACAVGYVFFKAFLQKEYIYLPVRIAAVTFILLAFAQVVLGFVGGFSGHTTWP